MTVQIQRRRLYIPPLHIDTNLINARQKLHSVNQLEQWLEDGVILINMSSTAHAEAKEGNSLQRTQKANMQIFTTTPAATSDDSLFQIVEASLFPDGANGENERNDVRIVCEAAKYGAILVTADGGSKTQPGGILGNRRKLMDIVQIMHPDVAVSFVRGKIAERDKFNQRAAKEYGLELPPWTGED